MCNKLTRRHNYKPYLTHPASCLESSVCSFSEGKTAGGEVTCSPPSNSEIMHDSSNISAHPACIHAVNRENTKKDISYTYCMAQNGKVTGEK